ncbi:AT-rich interactive domain-containing protein 2 [Lampetra fluviatilis]
MAHPGGAVEPRKNSAFLDALRQFHQGRGTPFKKTPLVGGREIDLHSLYTRVTSLGGYHKVTDKLLWEDIVEDFNFPRGCSNAPFALKQCYKRYLETYEKVHHFGEEDDEFQGSSRPQTPVGGISYTYNYQQHNVPDHMRQGNGLSTELLPASEYRKLALSLLSGLPNEVDFAVNVCTLLSHEGRRAMHLDRDPRLVALLLAHAGVFDDSPGSLFNVYDSEWRAKSGRDFIKFWKQSIDDLEVRELICDKNKGRTEQRPWGEWLLSTGRSAGVDDPECQRVLQISVILRNLSFLESNAKLMASHRACLRFLIMCAHCKFSSLRQMGLDTLGNIASELQLDPIDFRSTQLIFHTITKCLTSTDKFQRIRGMEILGSLCMAEENGEVVGECVEVEAYCEMVQLLVLPDVLLVLGTLEVLYQLSEIGEGPCSKIARVHRSIECLVSLATLDVQTMGTECLSAVKIVEHHTPAPHVPADSRSTSGAAASAAGAGGDAHLAPASGASRGSLSTSALGTTEVDGETFACQWMNSHFEASSDSSISRTDMYSEYLSTCSKLARSSILTSTAFSKGLKTIFPGLSYKRIEDPLNPGHVQYHIVGVRRRPSPLPAHAAFVPHRPGTPNRAGGLNSSETTATHAALPCPGSAPGGTAPSPGIGLQGPMVTLQRPPQVLPTHQSPCPPVIYTTSTIPPPPLPLLPPPPPYQPTAGRTTGQPAMSHSFPAYQTVVVSSCSAANKPGMGVIMTQARLPVSSTITGTAQQGGVVVHANAQPGQQQQQQQQPGVLHFSQAGQVITSQGTVQTTYAVVSSTQFVHVTQSSGFPVLNSSASPATMVVTTPGVQPAGALVTTQVQPGAAPAGSPVVVGGGGGCSAGGIPVGQPMLQITQPPSAITACHIPVIQSAAQPSGGVANHVQLPQTMDVSVQNSVARFQVVSQHQQQQPLNQQQQHLALYQGQVHHVTSSAGHVAFLHQALPTQGGSAVAAAVGPAAATSQQEPAMLGAAPHQQQHHALASAPTVIQSPTRHTFQNIAPKPASGTPTPAPSLQSPQQVHVIVGQQGGTCVAPGGPQHVPAVHQIVLAGQPHQRQLTPTPHGGGGGISSMAGVQPQMSACVAPQVVGIPSGVPTLNQMLTIRCQHQQQQQQPIQPAVSGAAALQQATPMQDSTSPLVKQLLLPRRNAVTPAGKMILAVPQTSQTLPRPASPQVVYQVTSGPGAGGLVTAQGGQLQQFVVGQAGPASGQHLVVGQAGGQQIIVGQATCPHAPQIVVGPATSGQQIVMSGQPQVVGSGQPTLPGTQQQQQQQQQQQLLVGPTTNHGLPTQQIVMGQPASHLPGAQAHPFLVGQSSFQVIHHTSQSGIQTLPISHMQLVPGPIISSGASQVAITMMPSAGFAASSAGNSSVISATPATHNHGMPALNNISSPLTGGGSSLWQNQTNLAADGVLSLPPPAGAVAPELKAEALGTPMGCDDSKNSPTRPPDSPSRPAANGEASATNFSALPNGRNNKVELPLSPPCPGNMTCEQQQQQQQINPVNLNSTGILDSTQDLKSELLKQQQRPLVNGDSDMTKGEETYIPNSVHNHKAMPVQNHMGNGELSDERDSKPQCLPSTNGPTSALRSGCDAPSPTLPPALSHNGTAPGSPKPQAPHGNARSEQCPAAPPTTTATPAPTTNPSPTPMLTMTVSHDGQASAAVHPVAPKDGDCKRPPLKRPHDGSDALLATAVPNKVGVRIVSAGESLTRTVACAPAEMVQQQQATQQVMQIPSAAVPATPTPPPPPPPSLELTRKPNQHFMCLWKGCRRWFETNGHVFRHAVSEHGRAGVYPGRCLWEACEAHDRQRLSFITHLQDKHCTKEALQAGLKKLEEKIQSEKQQQQQQQPSSHAPSNPAAASMGASARPLATPPLAGTPPGFAAHGRPVKTLAGHPGAAMLALRRGSRSLTFRDFTDDKEGPITKSIRITACLVLRNIARHSESGRRLVRRHEAHLSTMALSGMEGSSTLAKCLYELAQHPASPQRRHARFPADDDQRL